MSSVISPQWQDKASGFFSASGVKLKEAGNQAGSFAKDAKENVVDVAGRVGSVFKSKWSLFQQPSTKHAVQERFLSAAASTSFFLRKGLSETKDKVAVGKTKVEEVAKKTAQKSKSLLSDIERWQKGVASSDGSFEWSTRGYRNTAWKSRSAYTVVLFFCCAFNPPFSFYSPSVYQQIGKPGLYFF